MAGKFEIFRRPAGYYFRLKAANGEMLLVSEGFMSKASAETGIAAVRMHAPIDRRYERRRSPAGYSFVLKGGDGEPIGHGEVYADSPGREDGIESVRTNAPGAAVEDLT
jgi:uncharacterized protein YegP (UPF0339 family)